MTATNLLAPTTKPAIPAQNSSRDIAKDIGREDARDARRSSKTSDAGKTSDDTTLTENRTAIDESGSLAFDEMMAALLNMPAPAQSTPIITVKPVANDTTAAITTSETPLRFGTGFSMDPALLVMPQDVSGSTLAGTTDSSFSAELLAALTPGTPVPVTTSETIASNPAAVPVPLTTEAVTPELTVSTNINADPRLIAAGFGPSQMAELKDKIAQHVTPQTSNVASPDATTANENKAAVITVTFSPEKSAIQPVTSTGNAAVIVATQAATTTATNTAPVETIVTAAKILTDAEKMAAIETGSTTADPVTDSENFDPVEFRIAQSFQRPVSTPANSENKTLQTFGDATQALQPNTNAGVQANNNAQVPADSTMKGKVAADAVLASSFASNSQMVTTASFDALTVNPAIVPNSVTQSLTSPLVQSTSASQSHPAVQTVAAVIAKNAKEGGPQTISIRLDPPELGKLQVQMKYKKGDPLKVHVVLEKADTAAMLQRDSHALESALKDAGLQTDGSSLSFELSQDGNAFSQSMQQNNPGNSQSARNATTVSFEDLPPLESSMDIFTDNKTGLTHYNLRV